MDSDIDKPMRPIIEEFSKSQHVKTVYCCAGHKVCKKYRSEIVQIYILFEMDMQQIGPFLELAFTCLTRKMFEYGLHPRITRAVDSKWSRKNRERIAVQFYSDGDRKSQLNMKQVKIARKYFKRLAEKTAAAL